LAFYTITYCMMMLTKEMPYLCFLIYVNQTDQIGIISYWCYCSTVWSSSLDKTSPLETIVLVTSCKAFKSYGCSWAFFCVIFCQVVFLIIWPRQRLGHFLYGVRQQFNWNAVLVFIHPLVTYYYHWPEL